VGGIGGLLDVAVREGTQAGLADEAQGFLQEALATLRTLR
jgi:hypothetical protein